MKFNSNPYYSPESCELEIFFEIDIAGSYEFDKFVIWKDKNNELFWDTDSGCSCPSPFDPSEDRHDLKLIDYNSFSAFKEELSRFINNSGELSRIINKVKNFIKTNNDKNNDMKLGTKITDGKKIGEIIQIFNKKGVIVKFDDNKTDFFSFKEIESDFKEVIPSLKDFLKSYIEDLEKQTVFSKKSVIKDLSGILAKFN